ncbi:astacin-like metalloendopeptidase [Rhinatrema bivittatum]|uniref:astacin-like metalloendopeptidase n=1 Tax=Rhinatrema bivittatum TaxID=194408 RepID=UPI001128AA44|nr:astacin-like metalloendopeptidase [Rhinatrema bivittatum]
MKLRLVIVFLEGLLCTTLGNPLQVLFKKDDTSEAHVGADSEQKDDVFSIISKTNEGSLQPLENGDIAVRSGRSALNCPSNNCFWPKSSDGIVKVPYIISPDYTADEKDGITTAMREFAALTCVQFVERRAEADYLQIKSVDGCWSFMGKSGGVQDVSLLKGGCLSKGTIQHELNHALGFHHEQSRSDRDNYVNIIYQYIPQDVKYNFNKEITNNLGLEYDYTSVMHYGRFAFTNTSGQATIVPKPDSSVVIGQRYGLSNLDISKINKLYQCGICSTLLSGTTGSFSSANYPSVYSPNSKCVWLIRLPANKVLLQFDAFDVQSSPGCASDYIRVYDGDSQKSPVLLDRACGTGLPPPLIASSNLLLVQFISDGAIAGSGFKASYSSVPCGTSLTANTGTFSSPNYPSDYPPNLDCSYIMTAPTGYKVSLKVTDFLLQWERNCPYDTISLYDGPDTSSRLLGTYCGIMIVAPVVSTQNSLLLLFHSDRSTQARGFQATYSFVQ